MNLFIPLARTTFLIPSGSLSDPDRKHLFVLLNDSFLDPVTNLEFILVVSITSLKSGIPYDATCVLKSGEHPFIQHDSYVLYHRAEIRETAQLKRCVEINQCIVKEMMNIDVFQRICKGLIESSFTPEKIKNFYRSLVRST
ncbi:hypothetical protein BegalDRAFT_1100 [Beggiatoa alba B18LD]|uniref:PemK-like protein n=1 Tax=Beggiatoa alba B18LD TaxID=395493 RepID=I3CEG0_9GAMM|nr:hypothetical protein [Beggiatoa alba]EIJ42003.1 hypothetical protein BegalDRAFT_1100 [Beggiatoa alba B18LD]